MASNAPKFPKKGRKAFVCPQKRVEKIDEESSDMQSQEVAPQEPLHTPVARPKRPPKGSFNYMQDDDKAEKFSEDEDDILTMLRKRREQQEKDK